MAPHFTSIVLCIRRSMPDVYTLLAQLICPRLLLHIFTYQVKSSRDLIWTTDGRKDQVLRGEQRHICIRKLWACIAQLGDSFPRALH